jgi:hypothetical protein
MHMSRFWRHARRALQGCLSNISKLLNELRVRTLDMSKPLIVLPCEHNKNMLQFADGFSGILDMNTGVQPTFQSEDAHKNCF